MLFARESHNLASIAVIMAIAIYMYGITTGLTIGMSITCLSLVYAISRVGG